MTHTRIINISNYSFSKEDCLFVDANVWMYLYYNRYPIKEIGFQRAYSSEFEKMRENDCKIYLDAMVLSEFINRFAKKEWEREIPAPMREGTPFKKFRAGQRFRVIAKEIAKNAKKMLQCSTRCNLKFSSLDIYRYIEEYSAGNSDFNDLMYRELCVDNNFILVTHDRDFKNFDQTVLTANPKLYR